MQFLTDGRRSTATYGPDAMAIARQEFRKLRLSLEPEDVIGEAVGKIVRWCRRHPERPVENLGGLFRTACRQVCLDLVRGNGRRVHEIDGGLPDEDGPGHEILADRDDGVGAVLDEVDGSSAHQILERLRVLIERLGSSAVAISGALTFVTLSTDPDIDVSDAPAPKAGVARDRAFGWPALWFATRHPGLFVNNSSVNRRRQRRISEIFTLLDQARAHLTVDTPAEHSSDVES